MYSGDEYYGDDVTSPLAQPEADRAWRVCWKARASDEWQRLPGLTQREAYNRKAEYRHRGKIAIVQMRNVRGEWIDG